MSNAGITAVKTEVMRLHSVAGVSWHPSLSGRIRSPIWHSCPAPRPQVDPAVPQAPGGGAAGNRLRTGGDLLRCRTALWCSVWGRTASFSEADDSLGLWRSEPCCRQSNSAGGAKGREYLEAEQHLSEHHGPELNSSEPDDAVRSDAHPCRHWIHGSDCEVQ